MSLRTAAVFIALTFATAAAVDAKPRARKGHWITMSATAYCRAGITQSGVRTRRGTVATDPARIPLGSTVRVRGLRGVRDGAFVVADTGSAITGKRIDVFVPDCRAARAFGRQPVRVLVVRRGPQALAAQR